MSIGEQALVWMGEGRGFQCGHGVDSRALCQAREVDWKQQRLRCVHRVWVSDGLT